MKTCAILSTNGKELPFPLPTKLLSLKGKELPFLIQELYSGLQNLCYVAQTACPKVPLRFIEPNQSGRGKRSDWWSGISMLLVVFIRHMDLMTLKIGTPQSDGGFRNVTIKFLANETGLSKTTVKRYLRQLVKAGYLEVSEQIIKARKGGFCFKTTIKTVSHKLIDELGLLNQRLEEYRNNKYKTTEPVTENKINSFIRKGVKAVSTIIDTITGKEKPKSDKKIVKLSELEKRNLTEQAYALYIEDKTLSPSQHYEKLLRKLKPPP